MKLLEVGAVLSVGVFLGWFLPNKLPLFIWRRRHSSYKGAFALLITIKFSSVTDKLKFKELFTPFAEWVAINEPGTISYEMSESDKVDTQVFITERYKTKKDFIEVHRKTPTFLAFRQRLSDMSSSYTMEGHSYVESNVGFI